MNLITGAALFLVTTSAQISAGRARNHLPVDGAEVRGVAASPTDSMARVAEIALWDAYRTHSRSQLAALLATSFVNVDPGGEANKAQILAGLDNYHVASFAVDVIAITPLSDSMVLLRSHVTIRHDWKGKPLPGDLTSSTIWRLSANGMAAIYHQDTANP